MGFKVLTFWGLAMLVGMLLGPLTAMWKNRDRNWWGFWCFLMPPALLILLVLPRRKGPRIDTVPWDERDRRDHLRQHPPG